MSNPSNKLAVVVVNWNAGPQLRNCLESLQGSFPTIVVDNASTDKSCDGLQGLGNVALITAEENLGFGKACNLGASQVEADYVLFLNPDAAVFPDTIERAMSVMDDPENADVGICGVQLVDKSGQIARGCARFPSPLTFLVESIGLARFFPRLGLLMSDWSHDRTKRVDHVIGAFFLVRAKLLSDLGGFDERFFLYLEDLDFSLRSHQAGWKSLYLADVQAFHKGGGTSDQIKARRLFYVLRSRLLYADKHFGRVGCWAVVMATCLIEPLSRSVLALGRRSWSSFVETWQGYFMLFRWLPMWLFKGVTR